MFSRQSPDLARSAEQPEAAAIEQPAELRVAHRIERASWLSPALLIATIGPADTDAGQRRLLVPEQENELDARWLTCAQADGDASRSMWLVTIALPSRPGGSGIDGLVLEDDGERRPLLPDGIDTVLCGAREFGEDLVDGLDANTRMRVASFLAAAPAAHAIEPDPELSGRLATLRDAVREPLSATEIRLDPSCVLRLETVLVIDECTYWLSGWLHHAAPRDGRLTVVTPEGLRIEPPEGTVSFHRRPDVDKAFGEKDASPNVGVHIYVKLERPSHCPGGWLLEFRSNDGHAVEDRARSPVSSDPRQIQRRALEPLRADRLDDAVVAAQVVPALAGLRARDAVVIEQILEYGPVTQSPDVSIVIAVRLIDRIELQLAQFARDGGLGGAELIYVIPPAATHAVHMRAASWYELYRVPFRLVELSGGARRPRALNVGAAAARGRLLVLMSGDVFPADPGWLDAMVEFYDATPRAGVVGPRLLHSDGSIAHAGTAYASGDGATRWQRTLPMQGLSSSLPAARGARPVHALSEACMMMSAERFRDNGGLSEDYLDGADEAADLCLKIAEDQLEIWQADVGLYWLERARSWPQNPAPIAARYNDWLLDRRWGARLAATAAREQTAPVVTHEPPALSLSFPGIGSPRSDAPVEILDVTPSQTSGRWVLDASLVRPSPGTEVEPYDNTYAFSIEGWAIAHDGGPLTVEVREGARTLRQAAASIRREDVAVKYPGLPGAEGAGFQTVVGTVGLPPQFKVEVDIVAADGSRALLATISGRRRPLRAAFAPSLQPLLITTLGRTGSSWLALLLSKHPEIVAYRPFVNEARVASYWMEVLRTLAEPASYIQAIRPELYKGHWWIGDERPSPLPLQLGETHMPQWMGSENVEILAGFCMSRIDGFYSELAQIQEASPPRYLAEKCWPDEITPQLMGELYPAGREIILVRDFRDMVCSIIGFNAKRGFPSFGREATSNDEEFIRFLRGSAERMLQSWNERRDRTLLVRYEDLILEPETTLAEVFSYLDVDSDSATILETIASATAMRPHVQRAHQTSASVEASVGRWKQELSDEHKAICDETFGEMLEAFGYEPTDVSDASIELRSAVGR